MKKRLIISGIIALIVSYFIYSIARGFYYNYSESFSDFRKYQWIFKDSIQSQLKPLYCHGRSRKSDNYYNYKIKNLYVGVWDITGLNKINLDSIKIENNLDLEDIKIKVGYVWQIDVKPKPEISVTSKFSFSNSLVVKFNNDSKIVKEFKSNNYRAYYGEFNRVVFSNNVNSNFIILDYGFPPKQSAIVFSKMQNKFLMILINADVSFDENIINILSL